MLKCLGSALSEKESIYEVHRKKQPVITTRIYAQYKIKTALKFMSSINSDLLVPAKKLFWCKSQVSISIPGTRLGRWVASNMTNMINSSQIKTTYTYFQ